MSLSNYKSQLTSYQNQLSELEKTKQTAQQNTSDYKKWLLQYSQLNANKSATQTALEQYQEANNTALKSKQQAYISQQNAKKYLSDNLALSGLGNSGLQETTLAKMYNNYNSNLSLAENTKAQTQASISDNLASTINNNQLQQYNSEIELMENDEAKAETKKAEKYNNVASLIDGYSSTSDKQKVLETYKNELGDEGYNLLQQYVNQYDIEQNSTTRLENSIANAETVEEYQNILNSDEYKRLDEATKTAVLETINNSINAIETSNSVSVNAIDGSKESIKNFYKTLFNDLPYDYYTSSSKQAQLQDTAFELARSGKLENGTVINFNYGKGSELKAKYINGKWIPTTDDVTYSYEQLLNMK